MLTLMDTVSSISYAIESQCYGTLKLMMVYKAVEVCLAICAECFIGCIESMVQYFNR